MTLLRMDLNIAEAEVIEEALDAYRQSILDVLDDDDPTPVQKWALDLSETIGRALRTSIDKHRALALKNPPPSRKQRRASKR